MIVWGIFATDDSQDYCDIVHKFLQCHPDGFVMDLVLVLLNENSTTTDINHHFLSQVVLKNISPEKVLIAINQIDKAMEGCYWNHQEQKPQPELITYLNKKVQEMHQWIKVQTGFNVPMPIYCSIKQKYNTNILLQFVIDNLPRKRGGDYCLLN